MVHFIYLMVNSDSKYSKFISSFRWMEEKTQEEICDDLSILCMYEIGKRNTYVY